MKTRVGINGFGRMGRLALRTAWDWPDLQIVQINETAGDAHMAAHLLEHDSIHGHWPRSIKATEDALIIDDEHLAWSSETAIEDVAWNVDVVVECTGKFKSQASLAPYFDKGVKKVVVSAPVKDGTPNVVVGVNDSVYDPDKHPIVTAASCTTNCIAPVIDVLHRELGIRHGSITTIHDITNTQSILDQYHKDPRRARASGTSLIPTSTGSATAIAEIFPELFGRLSGIAVRVPMANASLTDIVMEVNTTTDAQTVNAMFQEAAEGRLQGILGVEHRPLVSIDFKGDTRSSIVDALSTMVIDGTHVKVLAWYDNEIGYVNRMMELTASVAARL